MQYLAYQLKYRKSSTIKTKSLRSQNSPVGHSNLIHESIHIGYVELIYTNFELIMYLIKRIRFGTYEKFDVWIGSNSQLLLLLLFSRFPGFTHPLNA